MIRNDLSAQNADKGYPAFMRDLIGRKIGVPVRGGAGEFQFVQMLQKAGYRADDVSFVAVGAPNTSYPALISGRVDAVHSFEPTGTMQGGLARCHGARAKGDCCNEWILRLRPEYDLNHISNNLQ